MNAVTASLIQLWDNRSTVLLVLSV